MTDAEWKVLGAYVDDLRHQLLLDHWTIELVREPPVADGDAATVDLIDGQMEVNKFGAYGKLRVHENFRQGDPDLQRLVILHELIHCHVDPLFSDMTDLLEGFAAKQAFEAVDLLNRRHYERMTDMLAQALAPRFPLIDWPTGDSGQGAWSSENMGGSKP